MRSSPPLRLLPEDKLDLLRYLDEFRFWHSLDDERRCARCHQTITGRQVIVFERQGTRGGMRLQYPTVGCVSTPSEWAYANPVLAASFPSYTPARKFDTSSGNVRFISDARERSKHLARRAPSTPAVSYDGRRGNAANSPKSIRAFLARLPILRSVAMGRHVIHPLT